jgi:predicted phosphoribosyltransferase
MNPGLFRDRREADRRLAEKLVTYANRPDVLVLALPRGGCRLPMARALGATAGCLCGPQARRATMQAAIEALRHQNPPRIVVAVPTASPDTSVEMKKMADDVICAMTPELSMRSVAGTRIFRRGRMKRFANCWRA